MNVPSFDEAEQRRLAEASLRSITLTTSKTRGEAFFRELVKALAEALDVHFVIAGRVTQLDGEEGIQTLAVWAGNDFMPNIAYALRGTPCRNVADQSMCYHARQIQAEYPDDHLLVDMQAESYIGMPMVGADGNTLGILVALDVREIDERKRYLALSLLSIFAARGAAELQHQDREAQLESLVAARTAELLAAQQRLMDQEKFAALGGLVAGISHEINTPLGVAVTSASTLVDTSQQLKAAIAAERVSRRELARLASLIDETARYTLDGLARANALVESFKDLAVGQTHDTEMMVELSQHLRNLLDVHRAVLKKAGASAELDAPEPVRARIVSGMFAQVISNLLMNAVTHAFRTPGGKLHLGLRQLGEREVEIRISDNGPGVSADVAKRMFEPFYTTRRGSGGSGLGLHIVYTLTQKMGGSIEVDDAPALPGLGLRLRLPRHMEKPESAPEGRSE